MRRLAFLVFAPLLATVASCLGPTEIEVHVTTNACSALSRVDIYVGGEDAALSAPATSTGGCVGSNEVGTLTIVPSGGVDSQLQIAVVGAVGGSCSSPTTTESQCIVARRSLSFVPHSHLELPVFLDSACAGFACPDGQTCEADPTPHCVGSTCDAAGSVTCGVDAGGPPDASNDGPVLEDVPILFDVVPPTCPIIVPGTPKLSWSFDTTTTVVHEDHGAVSDQPLATSAKITNATPFCNNHLAGGPQPLVVNDTAFSTKTFTVAFAYRTLVDGTILSLGGQSQSSGYDVRVNTGELTVSFNANVAVEVFRDNVATNDGKWHTAAIEVTTTAVDGGTSTTTLRVTRDTVATLSKTPVPYGGLGLNLSAGSIDAIDQISYFLN